MSKGHANSSYHPNFAQGAANDPPMLGIHWARGVNPNAISQAPKKPNDYPLMDYHGGDVMPTAIVEPIFWGSGWNSYVGDEISGLDSFYFGFSGSNYAMTSDEYGGISGQVGATIAYLGHVVDYSDASRGNRTRAVLNEVCGQINPDPSGNGYYPVYTDVPRGEANYCAWHSWGACNGIPIQFAFFWKLDGDPGCDPSDTSGLHSQGLAALANVSAHELSEARTDPRGAGWYDKRGAENGDKCSWIFGVPLVTFSDGSQWKLQGEWSNAADSANTGYPNGAGQNGCASGQ